MINKKTIGIFIMCIFILSEFGASADSCFNINETVESGQKLTTSASMNDELDQSQTNMTKNHIIPIGNVQITNNTISVQVAQSFIPTKEILTKVELFIVKNTTATFPLSISIREELTDEDLTALNIEPSEVPAGELDWVEINFDDIIMTTGLTYYIVATTENVTDNLYGWGANNSSESYPYGCMWYSIDEGNTWSNKSTSSKPSSFESLAIPKSQPIFKENDSWDMCFKTYGFDNHPPFAPYINGPQTGKPGITYLYVFNSIDDEGDDVKYHIDWGDETSNVTDFNPSGADVTLSHNWTEKGEYTITAYAEDVFGATSRTSIFQVTIPRTKMVNKSLLQYLQSHPNLFPLLQKLIQQLEL
jgi:hypothetical protein